VAASLEQIQRYLEISGVESIVGIEAGYVTTARTLDSVVPIVADEVTSIPAKKHRRTRWRVVGEQLHLRDGLRVVGAPVDDQNLAMLDGRLSENRSDGLVDVGAVVEADHYDAYQRNVGRPGIGL